jgi:hypothetical protein
MTRARALKQAIRTRASRTGERYTTARRHVLTSLASAPPSEAPADVQPAAKPEAQIKVTRASSTSQTRIREKTGQGLEHWFGVLDQFGAVSKGHTAAARHLADAHGVGGWYAQGITVAYERARGVREVNQRCDGAFEVSVSKVIPGDVPSIIRQMTSKRLRGHLTSSDPALVTALATALDASMSRGFVVRPDGLGRFRYKWEQTTVQMYLTPKPGGKVSVVVTNMQLASSKMVEQRRIAWRAFLASLAAIGTDS